jgi:hypothetical protein
VFIGLLSLFIGPPLYQKFYIAFLGHMDFEFKEGRYVFANGTPALRIELLNRMGKDLSGVNATGVFQCDNKSFELASEPFYLEDKRYFFADGGRSEIFFSIDDELDRIINQNETSCVDGQVIVYQYAPAGENVTLTGGRSFVLSGRPVHVEMSGLIRQETRKTNLCSYCQLNIELHAKELDEPRVWTKDFVVVGDSLPPLSMPETLPNVYEISHPYAYFLIESTVASNSTFCLNMTYENCQREVCRIALGAYNLTNPDCNLVQTIETFNRTYFQHLTCPDT